MSESSIRPTPLITVSSSTIECSISAEVIRRAGRIAIVATEQKIAGLGGRPLRVDTGDPALDEGLAGWTRVVVGFNREIVYRIAP